MNTTIASAVIGAGIIGAAVAGRTYTKHIFTQSGQHIRRRVHRPLHRALAAIREYPAMMTPGLTAQVVNATAPQTVTPDIIGGLYAPQQEAYEIGMVSNNNADYIPVHPVLHSFNSSVDHNQDMTPCMDLTVPVNPELLAYLRREAFLRKRDRSLLLVLKQKAVAFLKDYDNSEMYKNYQVQHCVPLAFDVCPSELTAASHLTSPGVSTRVNYLNSLLAGNETEISDHLNAPHSTYFSMFMESAVKTFGVKDHLSSLDPK